MSNKYIQDNANEYYRPSIDDDDINFFPHQNMLPIYHFKNGRLLKSENHTVFRIFPLLKKEGVQMGDTSHNYLYASIFFFMLFMLINMKIINRVLKEFFSLLHPYHS